MKPILHWWRNRRAADQLHEEIEAHIEEKTEALIEAGMSPPDARAKARRDFGNTLKITEQSRAVWTWSPLEILLLDSRQAARTLLREPALTLTSTLTLAIAIGAAITVFSVVYPILLRPLPYPHPENLFWISERFDRAPAEIVIGADYYTLREEAKLFSDAGAYDTTTANWNGIEHPEQLDVAQVTPSFFTTLGMQAALGRTFSPQEQGKNAPPIVVLSHAFWRDRLGADTRIIGRTLILDRAPATVIGVMPQGFDFPKGTHLYRPTPMEESTQRPLSPRTPMRLMNVVARAQSSNAEQLKQEVTRLESMLRATYPKEFLTSFLGGMQLKATPLQRYMAGDLRLALLVLSVAVGFLVLIACVNLANLLLARTAQRRKELAVRLALGSGRARVIGQVILESLLLAIPGGFTGIAFAAITIAALNAFSPLVLSSYPPLQIDIPVLLFSVLATIAAALLFGLAPALTSARVSIQEALQSGGRSISSGHSTSRLRRALVVVQLSLSLILLIGAGLLGRSFVNLLHTDLGFPPDHLLTFRVNLRGAAYSQASGQAGFYDDVIERLRALPAVRHAAVSTDVPLRDEFAFSRLAVRFEGREAPRAPAPEAHFSVVSPEFFATLGAPLRSGRQFGAQDSPTTLPAVIVNEAFVQQFLPGEDAVGKVILTEDRNANRRTIVGVAGNIRGGLLGAPPPPTIYACLCQATRPFLARMSFLVRTNIDPLTALKDIAAQVYAKDRDQPVFDVMTMEQRLAASLSSRRFALWLVGGFAAVSLLLSAVGVYGVVSYLVNWRRKEIGIRVAMGARPMQVQRLILTESVGLAAASIVLGLAGAAALTRYLESMLYGVKPGDSATFLAMPIFLAALAIGASLVPAARAARLDPVQVLRED
ncbi:MAG: ABC transporter permease [Bryobacteraceae bacterium]